MKFETFITCVCVVLGMALVGAAYVTFYARLCAEYPADPVVVEVTPPRAFPPAGDMSNPGDIAANNQERK